MSAEILTITPTSGNAPEIHFGEHFRHPLWIEFVSNDSEKWFGCFSSDYPSVLNKVLIDKDNKSAFIVSGGIGYLVDINNKILKHKTDDQPLIVSIILTNDPDYFIAGTFYSIYVFDTDKLIQEITPNMTIDGLYFKSQIGRKAIGDLASAENQYVSNLDFEFNLDTFELSLNQKVIRKDYKAFETIRIVDKDWTEKPNIIKRLIDKLKNLKRSTANSVKKNQNMKLDFKYIYDFVIPLSDFALNWRFIDPNYSVLPDYQLKDLKPLGKDASRFIFDYLKTNNLHSDLPFKSKFFKRIDSIEITENNDSKIKDWLLKSGLDSKTDVILSWDIDNAMILPFRLLVEYFDVFYYSSSDDLTVFQKDLNWAFLFFHADQIYYGTK